MSPELATAFYPVLLCGVLALISMPTITFVERRLKRRKKVRCMVWDWKLESRGVGSLDHAVFSFEAYLLNPRPSLIRLRSASVVLLLNYGRVAMGHPRYSDSDEALEALDLQPWQVVRINAYALFEDEEAREILSFRQADLIGLFSGGKTFRWKVAGRGDFAASPKKPGLERRDFVATYKRGGFDRRDFAASRKKLGSECRYYGRPRWHRLTAPPKVSPEHR